MIPYGRQNIDSRDKQAVLAVLNSPYITQGPAIPDFEQAVCRYTGARYGVAVSNGTTALHLAYLAAGLGRGDEIIMPANTFVATANAAVYVGAHPVFADIDPLTHNIDPHDIRRRITPRTRAIVVVHFAGHPCPMNEIHRLARRHKLAVIEDAAHALGASYHGRRVGHLGSLVTTLSFHPVKSITTGEGGMVMTDNRRIDQQLRLWRSHGVVKNAQGKNVMTALGYNYRMCDLQAALGRSQMNRLNRFIAARRQVVRWYRKALANIPEISRPVELPGIRSAWHLYVIQVKDPRQRDALRRHLTKSGIGANYHYPAVYAHPYYRQHGYRRTALPVTDHYSATTITLPLHTLLRQRDVRFVADTIRQFFHS